MSDRLSPLPFEAPEEILDILAALGRTEDLHISPGGSRLAIAAFGSDMVWVFAVDVSRSSGTPAVHVSDYLSMTHHTFNDTHGITFLDDEHIVVCNRGADVCVMRVPEFGGSVRHHVLEPVARIRGDRRLFARVRTPGSICNLPIAPDQYRILICNDQWNFVSGHRVGLGGPVRITHEGVLAGRGLQLPDGICVSADSKWVAISNHAPGLVSLYRNTPGFDRASEPDAVLGGLICPHGLDFDADGDLYVADAGTPFVSVYRRPDGDWRDAEQPSSTVRVMDDDTFYSGRYDAREGGVKAICVDRGNRLLATSHRLGPLEVWDLDQLGQRCDPIDAAQMEELRRERDDDLARTKQRVLRRSWTPLGRAEHELRHLAWTVRRLPRLSLTHATSAQLTRSNRHSTQSILDADGPVVSLTSHAGRIGTAHLAIESIARGRLKPGRLILTLSNEMDGAGLPAPLERLQARGLEVVYADDVGPHTKYHPVIEAEDDITSPLVTADDDVLYPVDWLERLVRAHTSDPTVIHSYRTRRIRMNSRHFEAYLSWPAGPTTGPTRLDFIVGVDGAIYPAEFLRLLRAHGDAFRECCPTADDIWLTYIAFREGVQVAPLSADGREFPLIPGSQDVRLFDGNVIGGNNQIQLAATFPRETREELWLLQQRAAGMSAGDADAAAR